jgi:GNAT superfamily N-acetyltransferase
LLNLALGAHYPPNTNGNTVASEIESVKSFFTQRDVPWYWWIGPQSNPANIGERLLQHDLVFDRPGLPALAARLPTHFPSPNPHAQVWQAATRTDLEAASTIRRVAFGFPKGVGLTYFEDMAADWLRGDPARLFLVRLDDGPPAAIGALIMGAGIPGIYIMATLPAWGRRGLGKAVMTHMLSTATEEGHQIIALTAGVKGYPLYRQFGFEHIFDFKIFAPNSQK